jgi:hypothetical protein
LTNGRSESVANFFRAAVSDDLMIIGIVEFMSFGSFPSSPRDYNWLKSSSAMSIS